MRHLFFLLLLIFPALLSFSQVDLTNGLVAYYPFNGNANDASGNGNNAVVNNAIITNDKSGAASSAYYFNGSSMYMRIPNSASLTPTTGITLFAIVKPMGYYGGTCPNSALIEKGSLDFLVGTYSLLYSPAAYSNGDCYSTDQTHQSFYGIVYNNGGTASQISYTPYIQTGTYYSVAYTYDGTNAKLYIDGVLKYSLTSSNGIGTSTEDLFLGHKNNATYPYWFNGVMDEVRIYNRAINSSEVSALSAITALPVKLTTFNASTINGQIKISWNVSDEQHISSYVIERSLSGLSDFVSIGTVVPNYNSSYLFIDKSGGPNIRYYYRLKMNENDYAINYSIIKSAKINGKNQVVNIYPNPLNGSIIVAVPGFKGKTNFTLLNSLGQVLFQKSAIIIDDTPLTLNIPGQQKGIYWLKIETNSEKIVTKIIVQ